MLTDKTELVALVRDIIGPKYGWPKERADAIAEALWEPLRKELNEEYRSGYKEANQFRLMVLEGLTEQKDIPLLDQFIVTVKAWLRQAERIHTALLKMSPLSSHELNNEASDLVESLMTAELKLIGRRPPKPEDRANKSE